MVLGSRDQDIWFECLDSNGYSYYDDCLGCKGGEGYFLNRRCTYLDDYVGARSTQKYFRKVGWVISWTIDFEIISGSQESRRKILGKFSA